jgi:pseudaminic acid cytidylyltransferase
MIAWPIRAALAAGCFSRVVVSTDDPEIAETARAEGAEAPFMRPAALADDHAGLLPVMAHAVETLCPDEDGPGFVCCILATAPLLRPADLREGLARLEAGRRDYVFSAARFPAPIQRAFRITADGGCEMFDPSQAPTRSQDLEPACHDAGQFYWGTRSAWLEQRPIFSAGGEALILPAERVADIDEPEDWARAEFAAEWLERRGG